MSAMSEQARSKAKAKAERLTRADPHVKVDASSWEPPEAMNAGSQTGPRPISRRQFKRGGKVHGEHATARADRKPRASGGALTANSLINRDMKAANQERAGTKHVGGMKRGGKAGGGLALPAWNDPVARKAGGKCSGGMVGKKSGGALTGGTRPEGGRIARAKGGRAKKGMNVNIIIAPGGGQHPAMPPPSLAPPGGPVGLRQGVPPPMPPPGAAAPMGPPAGMPPMARKRGGRAYPIESGAGGGLGRLEKIRAYG